MKFNAEKCHTLHYGYNNLEYDYYLTANNARSEIKTEDSERDLGVLFDTDLKFRQHINNSINKANKITGLVRRTFLHITTKSFRKLYKSLIRPHLEYCNIVWSPRFIKTLMLLKGHRKGPPNLCIM